MGDNSCSGSTPFKSLVDHGAQDRSLHQDRFSGAPGLQPGFRSAGPASSTQAQAAFGAFLGSNVARPLSSNHSPAYGSPFSSPIPGLQATHMAGVQTDQRLSPGPYQPVTQIPRTPGLEAAPASHLQHQGTASSLGASDWAQDFARFSGGGFSAGNSVSGLSNVQQHPPPPVGFTHNTMAAHSGASFFRPTISPAVVGNRNFSSNTATRAEADFDLEMDRWMAAHGDSHMEDVDAIMEELAREMEQGQQAKQTSRHGLDSFIDPTTMPAQVSFESGTQHAQFTPATASINHQMSAEQRVTEADGFVTSPNATISDHVPDLSRLGLEEVSVAAATEPAVQRQSQSEISEAARQILQSVQHEQGDKWKNSRFLLLMKEFRDGNKDIVNNEITETGANGEPSTGN